LILKSLLDLNVLIALTDPEHKHHQTARNWFLSSDGRRLGICSLTEAGFLRVTANPAFRSGPHTLEQAIAILQTLKGRDDYWYCPTDESWITLTAQFASRVRGHQQVTDAFLLGLAIKEKCALVTLDKAIQHMAGAEFSRNVLLLE
jgi:toxin-antitoxin system PIN domain toxin